MTPQTTDSDFNNGELSRCIKEFKERQLELAKQIEDEEKQKSQVQDDIKILTKRLTTINESLGKKNEEKREFERIVAETEAAYAKIMESSQTLLAVLKRESSTLRRGRS